MTTTETVLLERALHGDDEAYQTIVESYQNQVYHLCFRMLGNEEDAEDTAQEAFWKAYVALKKYDRERSFATWILSIAAHQCIDKLRKRRLSSFSIELLPEESIPDKSLTPEDEVTKSESEMQVQIMLNDLKPEDRAVIVLRYWYEMSEQEIASTLAMTVSAVKSRLHRARRALARKWVTLNPAVIQTGGIQHEPSTF